MTAFNVENWSKNHPYSSSVRVNPVRVLTGIVDFTKKLSSSATSAGGVASDTVKVIQIPANTAVLAVRTHVVTAEGATCTIGVGDSGSATRYGSALNINTTTNNLSTTANLYSSADDLTITLGHTTANAVVRFEVFLVDLGAGF